VFGAEGELLLPIAHGSNYRPGYGVALTVVEALLDALGAEPASEADAVAVVKVMVGCRVAGCGERMFEFLAQRRVRVRDVAGCAGFEHAPHRHYERRR
jgi:hypothetical protein